MTSSNRFRRLSEQFAPRGERAAIWDSFDLILPTDRFLNIGYSPRFVPFFLGDPQRRLARILVMMGLAAIDTDREPLILDVGCGRGGPMIEMLTITSGCVLGFDLIEHNVRLAARNVERESAVDRAGFGIGDAEDLPLKSGTVDLCLAVDSVPYLDRPDHFFGEAHRLVRTSGGFVFSTLVLGEESPIESGNPALDRFSAGWDLATVHPRQEIERSLGHAGWVVDDVRDLTPGSLARLPKWTTLYLLVADTPVYGLLDRLLVNRSVDLELLTDRVTRTHPVLPYLRHLAFCCRPADH